MRLNKINIRFSVVPRRISCVRSPSRSRSIRQANETFGTLLTKGLLTLNPIMNVISGNNMESTLVSVRPRPGIHSLTTAWLIIILGEGPSSLSYAVISHSESESGEAESLRRNVETMVRCIHESWECGNLFDWISVVNNGREIPSCETRIVVWSNISLDWRRNCKEKAKWHSVLMSI